MLILTLSVPVAVAQEAEIGHWVIREKALVWEKVFDKAVTIEEIVRHLRQFSWIRELETRDSTVYALADNFILDYDRYQQPVFTDVFYRRARWTYGIIIDRKQQKYRVRLSNFNFDLTNTGSTHDPGRGPYEIMALKRDRARFRTSEALALRIFDAALTDAFDVSLSLDDW